MKFHRQLLNQMFLPTVPLPSSLSNPLLSTAYLFSTASAAALFCSLLLQSRPYPATFPPHLASTAMVVKPCPPSLGPSPSHASTAQLLPVFPRAKITLKKTPSSRLLSQQLCVATLRRFMACVYIHLYRITCLIQRRRSS